MLPAGTWHWQWLPTGQKEGVGASLVGESCPAGAPRLGATKAWKREEEGAREASGGELTQGPEPTLRSESSLASDRRGLESAAP